MTGPHNDRLRTRWLALLMALVGATAVMGQSLYVRETLVAFFGNELALGAVFGAWLLGVAVGAWLGGRVAARMRRPTVWLAVAACVGAVTLPGGLLTARALRLIAGAEEGSYLPFHWLLGGTAMITIPFSFLVGFTFPVASRAARHREGAPAGGISLVYVAEAVGAVAGGLAFSFLLVGRVGAFRIAMSMMALVVIVATAPGIWRAWHHRRIALTVLRKMPAWCALALAVFAAGPLDRAATQLRWKGIAPGQTLVAVADSPYGHIALGLREGQYNLYLDGHFASAFPDEREFSHTAHLVLCEHPDPKRVLVIGGGTEGLLAPMLKHPLERQDSTQLDPRLPQLLADFITAADRRALADPRVTVFATDGRLFIQRRIRTPSTGYDVVLLSVPEPSNASLNRFYTAEFLREVKGVLARNGILAATLPTAGPNYRGVDALNYTGSFYHTLRDAFRRVVVKPGEDTLWFFAGDGDAATSDPAILTRRYEARGIRDDLFDPVAFESDFPPERVANLVLDLMRRTEVPRNTDERPITYVYDTVLWGQYSNSRIAGAFRLFERASAWIFLGLCAAVVGGWLVARALSPRWRRGGLAFAAVWSVGTFGFAAMALELVLLFAYQNRFGVIYQRIGAAVGLFMAGLAAGGLVSRWFLGRFRERLPDDTAVRFSVRRHAEARERGAGLGLHHERTHTAAVAREVLLAAAVLVALLTALALFLPTYVRWLAGGGASATAEALLLLALVVAGSLTGAMFPLASRLHLAARELRAAGPAEPPGEAQIGRTAGILDAADHAGACLGALLTGVVLVPLLGIAETTLIIAALAVTSLVLLLTSRPKS